MKRLHLICNAHLDPIWQWEWEEGAAAALSTFQSAANLAEKYDYIFCHNEVNLYKYTEKYAPALFAQIQKLVKQGKWHIMGGMVSPTRLPYAVRRRNVAPNSRRRTLFQGKIRSYADDGSQLRPVRTFSRTCANSQKMRSGQLYVYASLRKTYAVSAT